MTIRTPYNINSVWKALGKYFIAAVEMLYTHVVIANVGRVLAKLRLLLHTYCPVIS